MALNTHIYKGDWVRVTNDDNVSIEGQAVHDLLAQLGGASLLVVRVWKGTDVTINVNFDVVEIVQRNLIE